MKRPILKRFTPSGKLLWLNQHQLEYLALNSNIDASQQLLVYLGPQTQHRYSKLCWQSLDAQLRRVNLDSG